MAMAKLLAVTLLRRCKANFPSARSLNIVDDYGLQALGGIKTVAVQLSGAHNFLLEGFKKLKQPVSLDKSGYLANSSELEVELNKLWVMPEGAGQRGLRDLGTDATDGRWRVAKGGSAARG